MTMKRRNVKRIALSVNSCALCGALATKIVRRLTRRATQIVHQIQKYVSFKEGPGSHLLSEKTDAQAIKSRRPPQALFKLADLAATCLKPRGHAHCKPMRSASRLQNRRAKLSLAQLFAAGCDDGIVGAAEMAEIALVDRLDGQITSTSVVPNWRSITAPSPT